MIKKIVFILITTCMYSWVFADIESSGAYINPVIGYAYRSNDTLRNPTNNNSYSLGIFAGYSFDKYLAVDGNVTFLPNTSYREYNNYFLSAIAVRGSIWFSDFFSPYIRLGGGLLSNASNDLQTSSGVFFGIGGLFKLSNSMAITIDNYGIVLPTATENSFSVLSLGLNYGF